MTYHHGWLAAALLFSAVTISPANEPAVVLPQTLVKNLPSDQHQLRDQAIAELARAGGHSLPALLTAAQSPDPELSWRATETLQIVCATVDLADEAAIKSALVKYSRSSQASEAAIAAKLLRQWPVFRHHFAAAQLEQLGAEIADVPDQQMLQAAPAGGLVPAAPFPAGMGGFFGGVAPGVAEPVEVIDEFEEKPAKKPLFAGLLKAVGRALGEVKEGEAVAAEEALEVIEEVVADDEAAEEAVDVDPAAIEIGLEEVVADDVVFVPGGGFGFGGGGFAFAFGRGGAFGGGGFAARPVAVTSWPSAQATSGDEEYLQPGSLRIGRMWRGSDRDLVYLSRLQQIHTVILRDAPLTDAALAQLAKLPSLTQLRIVNTRVSSAALLKLRQQRPQLAILVNSPAVLGVAGSDVAQGLLVQQVTPETGARRAGLDEQDIITKVGGLKVSGINDVTLALYDKQPGTKVAIEYLRGGKRQSVEVELSSREVVDPTPVASSYPGSYPQPVHHFGRGFHVAPAMIMVD